MFESIGTIFPADRDHLQLKNHDRLVSNIGTNVFLHISRALGLRIQGVFVSH